LKEEKRGEEKQEKRRTHNDFEVFSSRFGEEVDHVGDELLQIRCAVRSLKEGARREGGR
jgi:hypothetical protein